MNSITTRAPAAASLGNAARLFGYDIFISFALGAAPRGSRSYASDLARRLRERDYAVFFSEDEAPAGGQLDDALKTALARSRMLVVIANRGTLADPRWVQVEVEEFRRRHPDRPIIPINIGDALQDAALAEAAQPWLQFADKIWIDDTQTACDQGIVGAAALERLVTAPKAARTASRWRWTVRTAFAILSLLTAAALWFAWSDRQNAALAQQNERQASDNATEARRNAAQATANAASAASEAQRAQKAEAQALDEAEAARRAARQARSNELVAHARNALDRNAYTAAFLLARHAYALSSDNMEARAFALYALKAIPTRSHLLDLSTYTHDKYAALKNFQLSDDSSRAVAWMESDSAAYLIDLKTGKVSRMMAGLQAISPDFSQAIVHRGGTSFSVVDLLHSKNLRDFSAPGEITAVSRDFSTALTVQENQDGLHVVDLKRGQVVLEIPDFKVDKKSPFGNNVAISKSGGWLAFEQNTQIQLWDVSEKKLSSITLPRDNSLMDFDFDEDKNWFMTTDSGAMRVFSMRGGEFLSEWKPPQGELIRTYQNSDGDHWALVGTPRKLQQQYRIADKGKPKREQGRTELALWNLMSRTKVSDLARFSGAEGSSTLSADGSRLLITYSLNSFIQVFDVNTGSSLYRFDGATYSTMDAILTPDGSRYLRIGTPIIDIWKAVEHIPAKLDGPRLQSNKMPSISADGRRMASPAINGHASPQRESFMSGIVLDQTTQKALFSFTTKNIIKAIHLNSDGKIVATISRQDPEGVQIWDVERQALIKALPLHTKDVYDIALSPDGRRIATAGESTRIWDTRTGEALVDFRPEYGSTSVQFSPDGGRILTTSNKNTVQIWSSSTGHLLMELKDHRLPYSQAVFSPDGSQVIAGDGDGDGERPSHVWDISLTTASQAAILAQMDATIRYPDMLLDDDFCSIYFANDQIYQPVECARNGKRPRTMAVAPRR